MLVSAFKTAPLPFLACLCLIQLLKKPSAFESLSRFYLKSSFSMCYFCSKKIYTKICLCIFQFFTHFPSFSSAWSVMREQPLFSQTVWNCFVESIWEKAKKSNCPRILFLVFLHFLRWVFTFILEFLWKRDPTALNVLLETSRFAQILLKKGIFTT